MCLMSQRLHNNPGVPCKRRDLPAATSELQIFYYLGVGHVFFNRDKCLLYFSDIEQTPVLPVLDALCQGKPGAYVLENMYMDVHHYLFGGYRVKLAEALCKPALVALRLKGVVISYVLSEPPPAVPRIDTPGKQ